MTALWTSTDAARATGGTTGTWHAGGLSIDTRTIQPGDLFIALKAARDGHDFVAQALAKGAAAAMVSRIPDGVDADRCLLVPDVQQGLEALGQAARARTGARILAITGSVGKTSAKELMRAALDGQGRVHAAEASYNNHWGVPLTLARMPQDTEYGIFEIGMSAPGEIAPLAKQVRPDVAMITTVAAAHLAAFDGLDGIAREKAAIFEGLRPEGVAIVAGDLDVSPILYDAASAVAGQVIRFGEAADNECRLLHAHIGQGHTTAKLHLGDQPVFLKLGAEGRHFATLALAVLAGVTALGADPAQALLNLSRWSAPQGRGQRETRVLDAGIGATFELIDDAFNANPTSMRAAFEVLAAAQPKSGGQRVAILGDMLELGPLERDLHADLAQEQQVPEFGQIHTVGPLMRALHDALPGDIRGQHADRPEDLAPLLKQLIQPGDVVLVKGSKGSRVSMIVDLARKLGKTLSPQLAED